MAFGGASNTQLGRAHQLFGHLWRGYQGLNPQVADIHRLVEQTELAARGTPAAPGVAVIQNDHIALRTIKDIWDRGLVGNDSLVRRFTPLGYVQRGTYRFADKRLDAVHLENELDPRLPRVFISELDLTSFSGPEFAEFHSLIEALVSQLPAGYADTPNEEFFFGGRPWDIAYQTYLKLLGKSQYAAWVAAFGPAVVNHFTVSLNGMQAFASVEAINAFLQAQGYTLNGQDTPQVVNVSRNGLLHQSSTVAGEVEVLFYGGERVMIPSVYYEFALRFKGADGVVFNAFDAESANKIFQSTDNPEGTPAQPT